MLRVVFCLPAERYAGQMLPSRAAPKNERQRLTSSTKACVF